MKLPERLRAAFVVARRDFTATVMSRTFLFFLLGPLFPVALGVLSGGLGSKMEREAAAPIVAMVMPPADAAQILAARERLLPLIASDDRQPIVIEQVARDSAIDDAAQRKRLLAREKPPVMGVLDGTLAAPHFTGAVSADGQTVQLMQVLVSEARRDVARVAPPPIGNAGAPLSIKLVDSSTGSLVKARSLTAQAGQAVLFFLTLLLAGMLLSQLIEEKSSKVIEILAASIPIDSIFLGKLFAMLSASLVGVALWASAGAAAIAIWVPGGLSALPEPAVGWPLFGALIIVYYAMSYLLIGSAFLGIGAQASTVREVQTISMPVTMSQMVLFFFCASVVGKPDSHEALAAAAFPLSSPYAMLARAAEVPELWPHLVAIAWQMLWVALIVRVASAIFRRSVLKSGPAFRWPWQSKARA